MCEIYVWSHAILIDGVKNFLKLHLNSTTILQDFLQALNVEHAKSMDKVENIQEDSLKPLRTPGISGLKSQILKPPFLNGL